MVGVVFAVVLVAVQLGLFSGFMRSTSNVIDHSGADVWITSSKASHLEVGTAISERNLYKALATPGVERAGKYTVQFADWKGPDGATERVGLIGFELTANLGGPWDLEAGAASGLKLSDSVTVDRLYCNKLGVQDVRASVEIHGRRARVAGFTQGIRHHVADHRTLAHQP